MDGDQIDLPGVPMPRLGGRRHQFEHAGDPSVACGDEVDRPDAWREACDGLTVGAWGTRIVPSTTDRLVRIS